MNMTEKKVRLHGHCGRVAIKIGDGETLRISIELADKLAKELKVVAHQIRHGYHYETTYITD